MIEGATKWTQRQGRRVCVHPPIHPPTPTCATTTQQDEGLGREGVPLNDLLQAGRQAGGRAGASKLAGLPLSSHTTGCTLLSQAGAKAEGCAAEACAWQVCSLEGAQQQAGLTVSSGESLNLKSTSVCPSFVNTAALQGHGRLEQGGAGQGGKAGQARADQP